MSLRALVWYWVPVLVGLVVLSVAAYVFVERQFAADVTAQKKNAEGELDLLASVILTQLRTGNYQNLEDLVTARGKSDAAIVALQLTSLSGFEFAAYQRGTPAAHSNVTHFDIPYSYSSNARLTLTHDLAAAYAHRNLLRAQVGGAIALVATLLGFLMYALVQRNRESELLRARTQELNRLNQELQDENDRRRQVEAALAEAKERAEVTLHSIGDAVITAAADGSVEYLNPVAEYLTGWPIGEAHKRSLDEIFQVFNEVTRAPLESPLARVRREGRTRGLTNHTVLLRRDGSEIAIEDSVAPIRNLAGEIVGVVLVFHDVTTAREMAKQLSWQATHDLLTGLLNRVEFEKRLEEVLVKARAENSQHALLYLDLDQFKVVNDTCGHAAGDELLRQLSQLKQGYLRAVDTLARLGGDEFGILLEKCPLDRAMQIAETLREATRGFRFTWQNYSCEIGVSIGVVPIHAASLTPQEILAAADLACYAAKETGRNRIHLYAESDMEIAQRHGEMLWVSRLNTALKENRFVLYRQSIEPTTGKNGAKHFEALIRLRDEQGKLIAPGVFLPAAERFNLIAAIDRWVVTQVLDLDVLRTSDTTDNKCMIAINLSGASLGDERFLAFLREALADPAIHAERLCFEITETVAITKLSRVVDLMRDLKVFGCRFALDDFGAGLSSFGYLKNLPVDFLKIDGALVKGVVESRADLAMVNAINVIGHTLGILTIAEFVENDAIRARMAEIGVDFVQGYGVEMPCPLEI